MSIVSAIAEDIEELKEIRHGLHAHPELGFEEHRTAGVIADELRRLGIPFHSNIGKTGLVGIIKGQLGESRKSVGLRADMDALPLQECTGLAYQSNTPGRMHACGHDGHVTMLLAAARYLQANRDFDGTVYLIFQPGEEGYAGAREMVEDGLFERFDADEIYAMHNWPSLPIGTVSIVDGPAMGATDRIRIRIRGVGGHGGVAPHRAIDPVLVAGHLIVAMQSIVSRNIDPLESGVVSLCGIQGGNLDGFAVIPDEVELVGTCRSLKPEVQDLLEKRVNEIVQGVAATFGASAEVTYERLFPMVINASPQARFANEVARELLGIENVVAIPRPSLGGEDFSFMLQKKPGAYIHLGTAVGKNDHGLHNPNFDFNDDAIPIGGALLAALARRSLQQRS
ncbi:M20 aminoacylase family protein [Herbaspirillum sp. alder98]|uniref:M20 aminoacylase family protein n=1 Tax=Herbaspirillum sp. alder98 TaxID=2913096 RepID=UPI001CD8A2C5|nr:M20 aminoacylase family protein [Herbaspirillum sp. alder98]MCA1325099.1 amidohydrolase [Herbaspirillum sp. alder98]